MKVRTATLNDYDGITAVLGRNGLVPTAPRPNWEHLWAANPWRDEFSDVPMGWVLENKTGAIVGTFSNIPVAYERNGCRLRAAVAHGWAVDHAYRDQALLPVGEYFAQQNVDLLLLTTAAGPAAQIFDAYGVRTGLAETDRDFLFWISSYNGFARSALVRKLGTHISAFFQYPLGLVLRGQDLVRRKRLAIPAQCRVEQLSEFDGRFDEFWDRLRRRPNRLLAVRDRAALSWHFKYVAQSTATRILASYDQDTMGGYVVLVRVDSADNGLRRYRVADLQVLDEQAQHIQLLLTAARGLAGRERVHMVEVMGFDAHKRSTMRSLAPRSRPLPVDRMTYQVTKPDLAEQLGPHCLADFSLYDGDSTLISWN